MVASVTRSDVIAIVNAPAVNELISLPDAVDLVTLAMRELSSGLVSAPERTSLQVSTQGRLVMMPGAVPHLQRFGIKTLSLLSSASEQGLPSHQGLMLLFDSLSGRPLCAIDSHAITALRTAAATAVATSELARRDSRTAALLGCGSLAPLHLQAMLHVRPIEKFIVWSRTPDRARSFAAEAAARLPAEIRVAASAREAVAEADIVCTLTGSDSPVLEGSWLSPGQHLNLVGASTRASREVDDEAVARSYYVADCRSHALSQAGELRHAMEQGVVDERHIAGEIGDILNGTIAARSDPSMITLYKSLGHVAQDIRVANAIFSRLDRSDQVVRVPWPA